MKNMPISKQPIVISRRTYRHGGTIAVGIPRIIADRFGITMGCVVEWVADEFGIRMEKQQDRNDRAKII